MLISKDAESYEFDVFTDLHTVTEDAISRTTFGSNFEEGRKIFEHVREEAQLMHQVMQFVYIPGWRFLPTATNRKLKCNYKEMRHLIKGIINKTEDALRIGKANYSHLLSLLMESSCKPVEEKDIGMSIEEVMEECRFYSAGQETTTSLRVSSMILLNMHPHWQEQAREEVLQVFGDKYPHWK